MFRLVIDLPVYTDDYEKHDLPVLHGVLDKTDFTLDWDNVLASLISSNLLVGEILEYQRVWLLLGLTESLREFGFVDRLFANNQTVFYLHISAHFCGAEEILVPAHRVSEVMRLGVRLLNCLVEYEEE